MRNDRLVLSERRESNRPDPIDALIDSAARQMVAGEPSSSLRGAVRDRVARRRSPWLLTPALAGAAAAVVIAVVLVGRALLGPAEAPGERDNVRPTIVGVQLTRRLAAPVVVPPQEEEPAIPPIAIEPLVTVQIAVASPIAVESSGMMPIEIEPLQIEPLRGIE